MKKRIVAFILSMVVVLGGSIPAYALSASNPLQMTKYTQEKSNWCWAACAKMVGKYFGCSHSQSAIVTEIKGSTVNSGASDTEVRHALQYAVNYKYTVGFFGVPTFSTVKTNIVTNHYPIVAKINWNSGGAHDEVITGTNSSSQVYLVDPNKSNQWVLYSSLKSGTKLNSGTGKISSTYRFSK